MSSPHASSMTTTTAIGNHRAHPNMLCAGFNQDASCISVGTRRGHAIYNVDPFGRVFASSAEQGATPIIEMLFCTSLIALGGTGDKQNSSPRKLRIVNTKRQSTICELQFPTTVLAVRLNRRRLIAVLEEEIFIYDISNMKLLHTIETSPNPQAICTLSPSSENSYLAYPSPLPSPSTPFSQGLPPSSTNSTSQGAGPGDVILFDALTLSVTNIIQAHKSPLACLCLNSTGTLLATASDKGTVIRVFSVPNGDKVAQFRRGTYAARIFSLAFNPVSTLLAVTSDSDTVHIFRLDRLGRPASQSMSTSSRAEQARRAAQASAYGDNVDDEDGADSTHRYSNSSGNGGRGGYDAYIDSTKAQQRAGLSGKGVTGSLRKKGLAVGRSLAGSIGGFLPGTVTEMWDPQRDFAFLKLPTPGVKSTVALSGTNPQVMVITSEGIYYCYNIDLDNGGECLLQKSYNIIDTQDDASSVSAD